MSAKKKTVALNDWWQDADPVYTDEGNGQCMLWAYAREVAPGDWEYLLVEVPDGDGPLRGVPVLSLRGGVATFLARGQFIQGAYP
jgi:hypothetical protein